MSQAAFANGTMAHALDYDNSWNPANHPTSPTLPAILAIAEHRNLSGRAVIEALAAAFETQARVRMAAGDWTPGGGFHKPGVTGTLGATVGAGKLLQLDADQFTMALGIAGSRAGSISANTGTMTKSTHSGHAARMGVESAILAGMGWTAYADILGAGGFLERFVGPWADLDMMHKDFAAPLRMASPGVGFKKHPSNFHTQRPTDAALKIKRANDFDPRDIQSVEVRCFVIPYVDRANPDTGLDGKFSLQYVTAAALLDGESTIDTFNNERRFADDMTTLLGKIRVVHDETIPKDFDETFVVTTVVLKDGRKFTEKVQKLTGWVGHPLSREERLKKVDVCARRVIDKERIAEMVAMVEELERLDNVAPLLDLVRNSSEV